MDARPIVRDLEINHGAWRFEDTLIFVMDLQRDFRDRGDFVRASYGRLGLSDEEIDSALAFEFPPVTDAGIDVELVTFTVHCVCGVHRRVVVTPPDFETDQCICGRTWHIPVSIEPGRGAAAGRNTS